MTFSACLALRAALSLACTPYQIGGCGFCSGVISIGTLSKLKCLPLKLTAALAKPLHDDRQRFIVDVAGLRRIGAEQFELDRRGAAAEPDVEAAAAHLIEHADFLDHPQRMIERQGEDHRPEAQPLGALRDRRQENAGRRRHAERRPVVFGKMVGVESRAIEQLHDRKPLLVIIRQRRRAAIQVVEDSEFHRGYAIPTSSVCNRQSSRGACAPHNGSARKLALGFTSSSCASISAISLLPVSAVRLRMPKTDAAARDIASAAEPVRR